MRKPPRFLGPVTCNECRHEFAVDPVYTVACPTCKARPNTKCVRPSEHRVFGDFFHAERDLAADDAGAYAHTCTREAETRRNLARARRGSPFRMEIPQ